MTEVTKIILSSKNSSIKFTFRVPVNKNIKSHEELKGILTEEQLRQLDLFLSCAEGPVTLEYKKIKKLKSKDAVIGLEVFNEKWNLVNMDQEWVFPVKTFPKMRFVVKSGDPEMLREYSLIHFPKENERSRMFVTKIKAEEEYTLIPANHGKKQIVAIYHHKEKKQRKLFTFCVKT